MTISSREMAHRIIDFLPEDKLVYIISILKGIEGVTIQDEPADEFDLLLIRESKEDNEESMSLDEFVEKLGFNIDELQN